MSKAGTRRSPAIAKLWCAHLALARRASALPRRCALELGFSAALYPQLGRRPALPLHRARRECAAVAALTDGVRTAACQVKAERSTVTKFERLTEFTIRRVSEQNHDPIIAEEEREAAAAAAKEPKDSTAG